MAKKKASYVDVEFEARLWELRELLRFVRKSKDKPLFASFCEKIRSAVFCFRLMIIPAYGAEYKRQGRDLLDIAKDAVKSTSTSRAVEVRKSLKRHTKEIKEVVEGLEKLVA